MLEFNKKQKTGRITTTSDFFKQSKTGRKQIVEAHTRKTGPWFEARAVKSGNRASEQAQLGGAGY